MADQHPNFPNANSYQSFPPPSVYSNAPPDNMPLPTLYGQQPHPQAPFPQQPVYYYPQPTPPSLVYNTDHQPPTPLQEENARQPLLAAGQPVIYHTVKQRLIEVIIICYYIILILLSI